MPAWIYPTMGSNFLVAFCCSHKTDGKQLLEEGVYSILQVTCHREGSPGRNSRQELKQMRNSASWCFLCLAQLPFLHSLDPSAWGWHYPQWTGAANVTHQPIEWPLDVPAGQLGRGHSSIEIGPF